MDVQRPPMPDHDSSPHGAAVAWLKGQAEDHRSMHQEWAIRMPASAATFGAKADIFEAALESEDVNLIRNAYIMNMVDMMILCGRGGEVGDLVLRFLTSPGKTPPDSLAEYLRGATCLPQIEFPKFNPETN